MYPREAGTARGRWEVIVQDTKVSGASFGCRGPAGGMRHSGAKCRCCAGPGRRGTRSALASPLNVEENASNKVSSGSSRMARMANAGTSPAKIAERSSQRHGRRSRAAAPKAAAAKTSFRGLRSATGPAKRRAVAAAIRPTGAADAGPTTTGSSRRWRRRRAGCEDARRGRPPSRQLAARKIPDEMPGRGLRQHGRTQVRPRQREARDRGRDGRLRIRHCRQVVSTAPCPSHAQHPGAQRSSALMMPHSLRAASPCRR